MPENVKMNPAEALIVLEHNRPDLKVGTMWDYDENHYLIYVIEKGFENKVNYNDPYYLVSKSSPFVERVSSMEDFDKFSRAINSEPLAKRK